MRKPPSRRHLPWRSLARGPLPRFTPSTRFRMIDPEIPHQHLTPAELRHERPDEAGIRQGLVAHVRQLIAEGQYDTPERWARAEAALLRDLTPEQ